MPDHTFIAPTLRVALEKAQAKFGPSALFVSHRELAASARHPFLGNRVEVTVRLPEPDELEESDSPKEAPVRETAPSDLRDELQALRRDLEALRGEGDDAHRLDPIEKRLRMAGVSPTLSRELRRRVVDRTDAGVEAALRRVLPVKVPQLRREAGSGPRIVSLVGPTGVGKTTTLAKLAGRYALAGGEGLALVTIDTYRVAAADQLRAYADMLRVPCRVAFTPEDLRRILSELSTARLILIDTTGRSPMDEARVRQLCGFLADHETIDHFLCLSMTASPLNLLESARRFAELPLSGLVATKIDESIQLGPLVDLAQRTRLPTAWVTNGQEVPEDLEDASAERLASRIWNGRELSAFGRAE